MKNALLLCALLLLFACNNDDMDIMDPDPNALEWQSGKNEYNELIDGVDRNFFIHVPETYDATEEVPLLFMLHGSSGTGKRFYNISGWVEKADEEGFIAVFPTALEYPLANGNRETKWSAGGLENDVAPGTVIKDDIPFLRELVDLCHSTFSIDEQRIYISGFSNGGGFVKSRVIPEMSDVFAAASTGGSLGLPQGYTIDDGRFMPVYFIVGTSDDKVKKWAGTSSDLPLSAEPLFEIDEVWARTKVMLDMLALDTTYSETSNAPFFNRIAFESYLSGQGNEMIYLIVNELEHKYPNGDNNPAGLRAVDELWPWYMMYTREE
jgi:polyhydroxybutyrate depolymerase